MKTENQEKRIILKAKNSSGEQQLAIQYEHLYKEVYFTMWGKYDGNDIQIDFDELSVEEFEEFYKSVLSIRRSLKRMNNKNIPK